MDHIDTRGDLSESLPSAVGSDAHQAMSELIHSHIVSQMIRALSDLSIADHLAGGASDAATIAARENCSEDAVLRLMLAAAAFGLVTIEADRTFHSTELLATLRTDHPRSLRAMAMAMTGPSLWPAWSEFVSSVRAAPDAPNRTQGRDFFAHLGSRAEYTADFAAAMDSATTLWSDNIADVIDTTGVRRAVDVGGASGGLLYLLQQANPSLRGVVFDQPDLTALAIAEARRRGVLDRIEFVGGDFFTAVPAGDLYLLKFILHDWDDDHCVKILRVCREAMEPGGRIAVVEFVANPSWPDRTTAMSDMSMMLLLNGRERSVEEFDALFAAAGLRRHRVHPTRSPQVVMETVEN
jgi:hypothetical protein